MKFQVAALLIAATAFAEPVPLVDPDLPTDDSFPRCATIPPAIKQGPLASLVELAEKQQSDALLLLSGDCVVVERYFGHPVQPIETMSVTKSIASIAVGMLIREGKIASLDTPVSTWFAEWGRGAKAKVKLVHILTHTTGLKHDDNTRELDRQPDQLRYVRALPVDADQIGVHSYNSEAVELLSGIVRIAAKKPIDRYLEEGLFAPLGIKRWHWSRDRAGNVRTYAGLSLLPRDLVRIGLLLSHGGVWRDRRMIADGWLRDATSGKFYNGLLWWIRRAPGLRVTEERIEALRRADFSAADKLRPLAGVQFPNMAACWLEMGALLNEKERAELARLSVSPIDFRAGPPLGFYANGWLGQNLAVYPSSNLVAVRLKRQTGSYDAQENEKFGFTSFLTALDAVLAP